LGSTSGVTDSSLPRAWRVTQQGGEWVIELWRDVSDTITYTPPLTDFDLGGTTGQLWRIDPATKAIIEVDVHGSPLANADGIVLPGHDLYVTGLRVCRTAGINGESVRSGS
jgi:hypothetical protein